MAQEKTGFSLNCGTEMVISAICHLQEHQGSTLKDIVSFLGSTYDIEELQLVRPVVIALKRGMEYGFLKKINGNFKMVFNGYDEGYAREQKRRRYKSAKSSKMGKKGDKRRRLH